GSYRTTIEHVFIYYPLSLKFKSIFQSQPLLVLIAQVQCRTIFQRVTLCTCTALVLTFQLRPFNANLRVVPCHATLVIRMPEVIDLVAELCFIAQNQEAVCKALRDKELLLILSRQGNTVPLAIGLRITSEINSYIKHSTAHSAHQLALRILLLEV